MSDELHRFQCSFCQTVAVSTARHKETRLSCVLCKRWMAYLWSEPITTDEQRELAARGLVYNPHLITEPPPPSTKKPCATCRTPVERDAMIDLSGVGKFCSEACAQVGVEQHQAFMERLDRFYDLHPWVERPGVKVAGQEER